MSPPSPRRAPVFLVGGGRDREANRAAHSGLADALGGGRLLCLVLDEGDGIDAGRWEDMLADAGVADVLVRRLAPGAPVTPADLEGWAGLYVAGGLTPLYADLLAPLAGRLRGDLVYAGFSAGAAVAPSRALVGGWLLDGRAVAPEDAAEDLDTVDVVDGLGIVPFAVDVHATQWGTLARAVHAVSAGLVPECWAIDEGTALVVRGERLAVQGVGHAYRVEPDADGARRTVRVSPAHALGSLSW